MNFFAINLRADFHSGKLLAEVLFASVLVIFMILAAIEIRFLCDAPLNSTLEASQMN